MITTSRLSAALTTSLGMMLALMAATPDCWADFVYFDGGPTGLGTDFVDGANWDPDGVPGANLVDVLGIDDGFSSTFSDGTTRVWALRVGSAAKEHQFPFQDTRFGRLTMTGGTLEVIGPGAQGLFVVGRERENNIFGGDYNKNSIVDAADFTVWRDTLGSTTDLRADGNQNGVVDQADYDFWRDRFGNIVRGGEIIMTGTSTLTANGVIIGERTEGLLSVGPDAVVDLRTWNNIDNPPHFDEPEDIRIGNYGPAYDDFGAEPGLDGRGLVDVQGALSANSLIMSENGAKGEIRLSGGTVNLTGNLTMDLCGNCVSDPNLLALRSAKVSIIGSNGSFQVGGNIQATSATATFSFTADAGGVTTIVADIGTAEIDTANLELDLDAFPFTPTSRLTLIDAADLPGLLIGEFGTVTFLGSTQADVNYDPITSDVFLDNFRGFAVPEPGTGLLSLAAVICLGVVRRRR